MPQLRIEKYQKIWVPDLISGDEQKALAFCKNTFGVQNEKQGNKKKIRQRSQEMHKMRKLQRLDKKIRFDVLPTLFQGSCV